MTTPTIGIIGLGIMGGAMARNAKKGGFPVRVYNRSEKKRAEARAVGFEVAASPRELAETVDGVVVMVTGPAAVRAVLEGPDGVLAANGAGKTVLQMSTIDEPSTQAFAAASAAAGYDFLDCPVAGSKKQVEAAQLILLAGGPVALVNRWRPFLMSVGKAVIYAGDVGKGTGLKLCMNLIVAQMTTALCEAVALARGLGLDAERIFDVLAESPALKCGYFEIKKSALLEQDFRPAFSLDNMLKDVRFMTEAARRTGGALPVTEAVQSLMETASARGLGSDDLTGLIRVLGAPTPATHP